MLCILGRAGRAAGNHRSARLSLGFRWSFIFAAMSFPAGAWAQDNIPADPDPTRLANAPRSEKDWQLRVGAGAFYAPAFLGSKDYQLQAGPSVEVRYKDRIFLSVIDGAGVDVLKTDHLRAGPVVKFQQKRRQDGKNLFMIAGDRTTALRGLGNVAATAEAGGYVSYQTGIVSAKAEVRKGLGGHDGIVANFGVRLTSPLPGLSISGKPIIISAGPRATIVDDKYNSAYFGVDRSQSARSGLPLYVAEGGLQTYGVGSAIIIPLAGSLTAGLFGGFDRLAGDAEKSPLVQQRGSRNQGTIGFGLNYQFGL